MSAPDPMFAPAPAPARHLLDYVRIIYKRRWLALCVFAAVVLATAVYVEIAVPVFEARAQLLIDIERPRVVLFKDTVDQDTDKADYQQTQHKILQSRALATRILDELNLWKHPEFVSGGESTGAQHWVERIVGLGARTVAKISRSTPVARPREGKGGDETPDRSRAIDVFLERLTVAPVRNSRLVDVKFQSTDAKLAAEIVNTLTEGYIKQSLEFKSKSSKEASEWLTQQLDEQRKRVEASQAALQRYREKTEAVSTSERDAAVQQKLNELNGALNRVHIERTQKEFAYNQLAALATGSDAPALLEAPAVQASPVVANLKAQLTDLQRQEHQMRDTLGARHPDLIKARRAIESTQARLDAEARRVVEAARVESLALREQETNFTRALDAGKRDATGMRRKQIEYDTLEREATSDRQIFDSLLQRTKETGVSSELMATNIRVVDTADVPRSPVSPQKMRDIALAGGAGLMLAIAAAALLDYFDTRLKTPEEVKAQLGLPCLGLVPVVVHHATAGPSAPMLNNGVPAFYKEAFRNVRTSLLFASGEDQKHTVLVTSTGPNEGKSVVASNLAIGLAQTGRRVLLIDGDLRRPSLHQMFGVEQAPGLAELASGASRPDDVMRKTSIHDLALIAAGALPDNPAELLSSQRFKAFLTAVAPSFDWVIIDSPPVMAVTDPVLIAHIVEGVIFVVGAERTTGPLALNALEKLHAAHARFVGVVLNQVNLEGDRFFYADHYRQEYQAYYGRSH